MSSPTGVRLLAAGTGMVVADSGNDRVVRYTHTHKAMTRTSLANLVLPSSISHLYLCLGLKD